MELTEKQINGLKCFYRRAHALETSAEYAQNRVKGQYRAEGIEIALDCLGIKYGKDEKGNLVFEQ